LELSDPAPTGVPVSQSVKYELVIAKALGLEVPPLLLARADELMED